MDRIKKALDVLNSNCKNPLIIEDMVGVLEREIDNLREALVYVAFASHSTPLYMLPKGIALGGNDTVEVKLNAGLTVIAKHE